MSIRTVFGFLSPKSLKTQKDGRKLIEAISSTIPDLLPSKYDDSEPIRRVFNLNQLDDALQLWGDGLLWSTLKPKSIGRYYASTPHGLHDAVYISIEGDVSGEKLADLLKKVSSIYDVTIGYVHRIYDAEKKNIEYYKNHVMPFSQGLTTHDLRTGIPGICWAMYFGRPYLNLFGKDRLLSAPVYSAIKIEDGVYLQVNSKITDPENNYEGFNNARERIKQHLNCSAFSTSKGEEINIPDYGIEK